jgi:hypothetical protein
VVARWPIEHAEAKVAVGDERAHAEFGSRRPRPDSRLERAAKVREHLVLDAPQVADRERFDASRTS